MVFASVCALLFGIGNGKLVLRKIKTRVEWEQKTRADCASRTIAHTIFYSNYFSAASAFRLCVSGQYHWGVGKRQIEESRIEVETREHRKLKRRKKNIQKHTKNEQDQRERKIRRRRKQKWKFIRHNCLLSILMCRRKSAFYFFHEWLIEQTEDGGDWVGASKRIMAEWK